MDWNILNTSFIYKIYFFIKRKNNSLKKTQYFLNFLYKVRDKCA